MSSFEQKTLTRKEKRKLAKTKAPNTSLKLLSIKPLTSNQRYSFAEYQADQNLFLHGVAGTGKTFIALYLALESIISGFSDQNKVVIIRSAVPSRDIGFLPGNVKEKTKEFEAPYSAICSDLFDRGDAYSVLKSKNMIEFLSTSYVRGITLRNSIVILEEIQNYSYHEAFSVLTRIGTNCRVIMAGDFRQSDLLGRQKTGFPKLISIIKSMPSFTFIEFGIEDIVRSRFVREFLVSCINYEDNHQCLNTNSFPEKNYKTPTPNGADIIPLQSGVSPVSPRF